MKKYLIILIVSLISATLFASYTTKEIKSDRITIHYKQENQKDKKDFLILPQNSYKKTIPLEIYDHSGKLDKAIWQDHRITPIQLTYLGQMNRFHIYQIEIRSEQTIQNKKYHIKELEFSIEYSNPIDLTQKKWSTIYTPFLSDCVNPEAIDFYAEKDRTDSQTESELAFFKNGEYFFRIRQEEGFYSINLLKLKSKYPELNELEPYLYGSDFQLIPCQSSFKKIIYFQNPEKSKYENQSVYWLVFKKETSEEQPVFPLKESKLTEMPPMNDQLMVKKSFGEKTGYFFPHQGPNTLPNAQDTKWYWLTCSEYQQEAAFSLEKASPRQPATLTMTMTFLNPEKKGSVQYEVYLNDHKLKDIKTIERKESFTITLDIESRYFHKFKKENLSIINNDAPRNRLYLKDIEVTYQSFVRGQRSFQVDVSLDQQENYLAEKKIYGYYPLIFYRKRNLVYKYKYYYKDMIKKTNTHVTYALPLEKSEKGRYYFFDPEEIPAAELTQFIPDFKKLDQESEAIVISARKYQKHIDRYLSIHSDRSISVVYYDDLCNYFQKGKRSPLAVKKYLKYKLQKAENIVPSYAILMGDATNDFKGILNNGITNDVPSYYYKKGADGFCSDYYLSCCLGKDNIGDISISRLPFFQDEDFRQYLDKVENYSQETPLEPWHTTISFIADDEDFEEHAEESFQEIPGIFDYKKIYLKNYILEDNFYIPWELAYREKIKVSPDCTQDIMNAFENGSVLMEYTGHGAPNILAHERILFGGNSKNSDFLNMKKTNKPAFMTMMTCSTGCIDYPEEPWNICISEDLLRTEQSGAIGLFVPSGKGYPTQHTQLMTKLHHYLFEKNIRNFGQLIAQTVNHYYLQEKNVAHAYMYLLLGDPLLNLKLPIVEKTIEVTPSSFAEGKEVKLHLTYPETLNQKLPLEIINGDGIAISKETVPSAELETDGQSDGYFFRITDSDQKKIYYGSTFCQKPNLSVLKGRLQGKAKTGKNTYSLKIKNNNSFDWPEIELTMHIRNSNMKEDKTLKKTLHLKSGKDLEVVLNPELAYGMNQAEIRVAMDSKEIYSRTDSWRIPFGENTPEQKVFIRLQEESNAFSEDEIKAHFQIYNPMKEKITLAEMTCRIEGTDYETSRKNITINKNGVYHFYLNQKKKDQPFPALPTFEFSSPEFEVQPSVIAVTKQKNLDVAVDKNMEIRPKNPVAGQSLFFTIKIHNYGDKEAKNLKLKFFEEKKTEKVQLTVSPHPLVKKLAPGETKTLTYKYLPWKNEGDRIYSVMLDSDNKLQENNEDNNEARISLRIRTNYKFKTLKAQTVQPQNEEEKKERLVHLLATFANEGETDANDVLVTFYRSSNQIEENKIGEQLIEKVEAKKTYRTHYIWKDVPDGDVRWTYNIGLKVSTARVSSVPEEKEE